MYLIEGADLDKLANMYWMKRKVLNRFKLPFNIIIIRMESDLKLRKRIIEMLSDTH